ncbi:cytochrome P450 [Rhodococcus ruber]|uniref:Cytochrome P450 n=1 Tax=Rhodococcus ruber TaxID=1830 RepID=A0ABT4ML81_9NOCA|nr:cytochrome P450 [Rhodococcus ruber]MCZ4521760.1 cytochrome P450 [Rhodococcus ruber]
MVTPTTTLADIDLFSDDHLRNPYENYARLRAAGPVVWLDRLDCWVASQYETVRRVLGENDTFTSAKGVGLNDEVNTALKDTLIASDPPLHDQLRSVLAGQLSPKAIRALGESINSRARELVMPLIDAGRFDAITDLARVFPPTIVADLVGIPEEVRPTLVGFGDAIFQMMGPADKPRTFARADLVAEHYAWLATVESSTLLEGSWGRDIYKAVDDGIIDQQTALGLLSGYTAAGMDTTINALGWAIELFTRHPEQWTAIRDDRSLIPGAFNEIVRFESPVQMFTRVATTDVELGGTHIEAGQRVMVLYGSANRDETHFGSDAAEFDILRDSSDHLGFGYGLHGCVGQALARLEAHTVLNILADHVVRFHGESEPEMHLNSTVRGLESFVVSVETA